MFKIAYSGTHGTGKTSSVYHAAQKLQRKGLEVCLINETALTCPFDINECATVDSQRWIFSKQLSDETAVQSRYDVLICDRTVMDAVAYSYALGFVDLADACFPLAVHHMSSYDIVYLKSLRNHDYEYDSSPLRCKVDSYIVALLRRAQDLGADFELEVR